MEIVKQKEGNILRVTLIGRLDTVTSVSVDASLKEESGFTDIVFDFEKLEYLSSSGLRLLFAYRQKLGGKDHVIVEHINPVVAEILRVTGFEKQITLR